MDHFDIKFPASGGRDQWEDFPSGLLAISRGGRILTGEILKRFKKNSVKKLKIFDRKVILKKNRNFFLSPEIL